MTEEPKKNSSKILVKVQRDTHEMNFRKDVLKSGEFSDVSFLVGGNETRIFKAHRFVLMAGSQTFKNLLAATKNNNELIEIPGIEPDIFEQLLKYANLLMTPISYLFLSNFSIPV